MAVNSGAQLDRPSGARPATDPEALKAQIEICMFDQYGTVVDMQSGLSRWRRRFCRRRAGAASRTASSHGGVGRTSRTR